MNTGETVISRVRSALGRSNRLDAAPTPPVLDEPIIRLVHSDVGLAELFISAAKGNKGVAEAVGVDSLGEKLISFLRSQRLQRVAFGSSPLLEKLGIPSLLASSGLDARQW